MKQNGLCAHGLVWTGAALSIAEIEAGIQCRGNPSAILLGHALGGALLFAMGLIGGKTRRCAMQTTAEAFGNVGAKAFAGINLLQLVGWSAVMIALGAAAATALYPPVGFTAFCCLIGLVAGLWRLLDLGTSPVVSLAAVLPLAGLAGFLTIRVLGLPPSDEPIPAVPFDSALALSIALPLSWLPLVSDYTKDAAHPVPAAGISALAYSLVSTWMFILGHLIASAGLPSLSSAVVKAGIGPAGLLVVIFSAALSVFFDLHSSGESAAVLWPRLPSRPVGLVVGLVGVLLAISGIMDHYADFLALVASAFTPMALVLIVTHYLVHKPHPVLSAIAWLLGFLAFSRL